MKFLFKRLILSVLISTILTPTISTFAYDDVHHTSPYYYSVEYLRRNDVIRESKLFKPDILITKAEFIKYLVLLNSPDFDQTQKVALPFEDTRNNASYSPYFQEAIKLGILDERDKKIEPYKKITKLEALELLFHSKSIPIPRRHVGPIPYSDVKNNTQNQALIMRAIGLGIVEPERNDYFGLYKRVNRILAADMIFQMDMIDLRAPKGNSSSDSLTPQLKKVVNSWDLITSNFYDKDRIDTNEMSQIAIRALVESLDDPYSAFMDAEENKIFNDDLDGQFEGIGAYIGVNDDEEAIIISPIKDSPAYQAGIKAGDVVKKVDETDVTGESLYDVVNRIKGPKGSTVKITVKRGNQILTISVVRDTIYIKSVEYEVIGNGDIMHIQLSSFSQTAIQEFREVVEIISQNPKIKGVILDMRDNPGGLLDAAVGILNFILPKESEAVHIKYNYFNYTQHTTGEGELSKYPMIVLINKGSASASEIVAGALKEYGIATLIGETSFGKGTVQEVNYFGDNSSLKLTVAEWLTPKKNSIQGNGVDPDITVLNGESDTEDKQLNRAIQEINKLK